MIETVQIVRILPRKIWIEDDLFGSRHVMMQDEDTPEFTYATFHYGYGYSDNSSTYAAATALALQLGATEPIERKSRSFPRAQPEIS